MYSRVTRPIAKSLTDKELKAFTEKQSKFCLDQRKMGMSCSGDFDCENDMACSNNVCVKYGTIENYDFSDNLLACKSGFYGILPGKNAEDTNKDGYNSTVCLPTPEIDSSNYRCDN